MVTLQLEHGIRSFDMWKAAFDRDPIDRRGLGVRRHRILRPLDDPNYVIVSLDFDSIAAAEAGGAALRELWGTGTAAPALIGEPTVRIVTVIEDAGY